MKKALLSLIVLIVLVLAGGIYYVLTNLDAIVEAAIEKYGSEATQTPVRVDSVSIKLSDGKAGIHGLTIANPEGFESPSAFSLGEISLGIDLNSLGKETTVIDEINIDALEVFYEINRKREDNLRTLQGRLAAGGSGESPQADKSGAGPKLLIRKVVFSGGALHADMIPLDKSYEVKLPAIRLNSLGAPGGAPPAVIAREVLDGLLDRVRAEIEKQGIGAELKRKIEGRKEELKTEANRKLESEKQQAKEKLKNLLGR